MLKFCLDMLSIDARLSKESIRNLGIAGTQTLVTCINYIHHYCERIFGIKTYLNDKVQSNISTMVTIVK